MSSDVFSEQDIAFHRATASAYDAKITAVYGVYHRYMLDPFVDEVARLRPGGSALDLGCGTGVVTLALARRGFVVTGMDHSPDMLEVAGRKLANERGLGPVTLLAADVRSLPARDEQFDCVTCQGLLHHLEDMGPCLRELWRVLRPGGFFFISEPTLEPTPLRSGLRLAARLARLGRPVVAPDEPDSVELPIDTGALRRQLETLGLSFRMEYLTHLPPLQRALSERAYLYLMRAASWPWRHRRGDLVFVFGAKPE